MVTLLPKDDTQVHDICQLNLDLADKIKHSSDSNPIIIKALATMNDK